QILTAAIRPFSHSPPQGDWPIRSVSAVSELVTEWLVLETVPVPVERYTVAVVPFLTTPTQYHWPTDMFRLAVAQLPLETIPRVVPSPSVCRTMLLPVPLSRLHGVE